MDQVRPRKLKLPGIFISYRRSDSSGEAGRLFDDLAKHFGEDTVFMDVAAIEAGRDFRKAIEEGVTRCGVLLVVIGQEWISATDENGTRRLDDPADFVRLETAAALRRDIPVIPVLVRGAKMPSAEQLPDVLKELAYRNCIELTHVRWKSDIQLLVEALRRLLGYPTPAAAGASGTRASAASVTAQPGAPPELTESSPERSAARINSADLQRVSRELALHIGPVAAVIVKRAASHCASLDDLCLKVAEEIDFREEREKFLQKMESSSFAEITDVAHAAPDEPAIVAPPVQTREVQPQAEKRPAASSRSVLFVGGAVVVVLLGIFLGVRWGRAKRANTSPEQYLPPETRVAEPAPQAGAVSAPNAPDLKRAPSAGAATARNESQPVQRLSIDPDVARALLVSEPPLSYPPLARQAHVQGAVVLEAEISRDGVVESLKAVSGHPLLLPAAIEAVKQWRYKPYVLNGRAIPVNTRVIVNFTLSGG